MDVAATLEALLDARPAMLARGAALLELDDPGARTFLVGIAALHDLGKFARPFQSKCPDLWPHALGVLDLATIPARTHTQDGWLLWDVRLRERLSPDLWRLPELVDPPLLGAVFGHHGKPVKDEVDRPEWIYGDGGLQAAESCARDLLRLLGPMPALSSAYGERKSRVASWWIAGLVALADWIGSNQRWFPYQAPDLTVDQYWSAARDLARRAVGDSGLAPAPAAPARTFEGLTDITSPTPMQDWAGQVELPPGPVLFVIEDATGSGKTEAAQMLVHRMMAAGRASGAFWGMPTQATANAMYERQAKAVGRLFAEGARPSVVLAHGRVALHSKFQATVLHHPPNERPYAEDADHLTASAGCAAFLAEDRRAALLADIGAGTVDQALLAVLPSKFNTVRLTGLADKVLVLDEAHAYDAYMGVEAAALLRFQAGMGGSAIVLSATLPAVQRRELIKAWRAGADPSRRPAAGLWGQPEAGATEIQAYPLATIATVAGAVETPIRPGPRSERTVPVRLTPDRAEAVAAIVRAQRQGAAVAWIRNTVDDCLAGATILRERGLDPLVFHARFAQADRQAREDEVRRLFGLGATADERRGKVVVATQVIEQSLDLDFDTLVTDIAPMDLIVQRAGRFRRHPSRDRDRPHGLAPELLVLSPPPLDHPGENWLSGEFRGTSYVYRNPGVLWSTAKLLTQHGAIRTPGEIRMLVEGAYDPLAVPPDLERGADRAVAAGHADAAMARYSTLTLEEGYHGMARAWESDARVLTRLAEPQAIIRLARVRAASLLPWAEDEDPQRAWALSEVKVRAWRAPFGSLPDPRFRLAAVAVQDSWGQYEREIPVLPLEPHAPGFWRGTLFRPDGKMSRVGYSEREGLSWARDPGGDMAPGYGTVTPGS